MSTLNNIGDPESGKDSVEPMYHVKTAFFDSLSLEGMEVGQFFRDAFTMFQNDIRDTNKREELELRMQRYGLQSLEDLEAKMQLHSLEKMFKLHLEGLPKGAVDNSSREMQTSFMLFHIEKSIDDCNGDLSLGIKFNKIVVDLLENAIQMDEAINQFNEYVVINRPEFPKQLDIVQVLKFLHDEYSIPQTAEVVTEFMRQPEVSMLRVNIRTVGKCVEAVDRMVSGNGQLAYMGNYTKNGLLQRYKAEFEKYSLLYNNQPIPINKMLDLRNRSILVSFAFGFQALAVASQIPRFALMLQNKSSQISRLFDAGASIIGGDNDLGTILLNSGNLRTLIKEHMRDNETPVEFFRRVITTFPNQLAMYPTIQKDVLQGETNIFLNAAKLDSKTYKDSLIENLTVLVGYYSLVERELELSLREVYQYSPYTANLVNLFCAMNRTMYRRGDDYDTLGRSNPAFYSAVADNLFHRNPSLYFMLKAAAGVKIVQQQIGRFFGKVPFQNNQPKIIEQ